MTPTLTPTPTSSTVATSSSPHIRWPAEKFYWAVLSEVSIPTRRLGTAASRAVLENLFEPHLPREIIRVATAFVSFPPNRIIACGVADETLRSLSEETITLAPDRVPAVLASDANASLLNVLVHSREPRRIRRARWHRSLTLCVGVTLVGALTTLGAQRRVWFANARESVARDAINTLWQSDSITELSLHTRDVSRLTGLVSDLERRATGPQRMFDPPATLQMILEHWPSDASARVDTLTLADQGIGVSGTVPDHAQAQQLATAMSGIPDWVLQQPQVQSSGERVRVILTLKPGDRP